MPRQPSMPPSEIVADAVSALRGRPARLGLDEEASGKLRELYEKLRERERSTPKIERH